MLLRPPELHRTAAPLPYTTVVRAVGQRSIRQAQRVEAHHGGARRQQVLYLGNEARGVEGGDEDGPRLRPRQVGHRLRLVAEDLEIGRASCRERVCQYV